MMRITAKREDYLPGLASIGQGPRGYDLRVDGEVVGQVAARKKGMWDHDYTGWIIVLYQTEKVEKRLTYTPKGNKDGWPLTDEGLATAKQIALDLVKKIYG